MLANVWSEQEWKKKSSKVFSTGRSIQLQAIDSALRKAHLVNPASEQCADALIALLGAIADWRKTKNTQGKSSGRSAAVDRLEAQLTAAAETMYRRKVAGLNSSSQRPTAPAPSSNPPRKVPLPTPVVPAPSNRPTPPRPAAPGTPVRGAAQERLFDSLAQAMLDQRRRVMAFDEADLFDDCDAAQKGRLTARWTLCVPSSVTDVNAARAEALRVLGAMLGNDVSVIKSLLERNVEVVVVARDQGMTVLEQFKELAGQKTFDGRTWDVVRGVGGLANKSAQAKSSEAAELQNKADSGKAAGSIVAIDPSKGKMYVAVTEENLLGGLTSVTGAGCYATGYSTTSHEFAHAIHLYGLSAADRSTVDRAYALRIGQGDSQVWVDGMRVVNGKTCYAASNSQEYFAQLSNAWFGANKGTDPYTGKSRNNGRGWVVENEPRPIVDLLERIYGQAALSDLNPAVVLKS